MFKFYHGADGLIRNEDDQQAVNPRKVDTVYNVDLFHPEVIHLEEESVIDKLYHFQIHSLPKPDWVLSMS